MALTSSETWSTFRQSVEAGLRLALIISRFCRHPKDCRHTVVKAHPAKTRRMTLAVTRPL